MNAIVTKAGLEIAERGVTWDYHIDLIDGDALTVKHSAMLTGFVTSDESLVAAQSVQALFQTFKRPGGSDYYIDTHVVQRPEHQTTLAEVRAQMDRHLNALRAERQGALGICRGA